MNGEGNTECIPTCFSLSSPVWGESSDGLSDSTDPDDHLPKDLQKEFQGVSFEENINTVFNWCWFVSPAQNRDSRSLGWH